MRPRAGGGADADSQRWATPVPSMQAFGFVEDPPRNNPRPPEEEIQNMPVAAVPDDRPHIIKGDNLQIFLAQVLREEFQELGIQFRAELFEGLSKFAHSFQPAMPTAEGHSDSTPVVPTPPVQSEESQNECKVQPVQMDRDRPREEPSQKIKLGKRQTEDLWATKVQHSGGGQAVGKSQTVESQATKEQNSGGCQTEEASIRQKKMTILRERESKSLRHPPAHNGNKSKSVLSTLSSGPSKSPSTVSNSSHASNGTKKVLSHALSAVNEMPQSVEAEGEGDENGRRSSESESSSSCASSEPEPRDHRWRSEWSDHRYVPAPARNFMRSLFMNHLRTSDSSFVSAHCDGDAEAITLRVICGVVIENPRFDFVMAFFLVLNAACLGAQVDVQARAPNDELPQVFRVFDVLFAIIFTLELSLRFFVHRWNLYRMSGRGWNILDTVLVIQQLTELICVVALRPEEASSSNITNATARLARFLRVLRMLRVIRIVRIVRFVGELRRVVYLILASMLTFMWAAVLLALLIYVLAVVLTQAVADSRRENPELSGSDLIEYFGTTGDSIYNLYLGITGGLNWGQFSTPLKTYISPLLAVLVALYVAFACFVILNLVTGVFVEGAMSLTKEDKRTDLCRRLQRAFKYTDTDNSGFIILEEFEKACRGRRVIEVFQMVGITTNRARELFSALDVDDNGGLNVEEFTEGIMQLRDPLNAVHFFMFAAQMKTSMTELLEAHSRLRDQVERSLDNKQGFKSLVSFDWWSLPASSRSNFSNGVSSVGVGNGVNNVRAPSPTNVASISIPE